MRNKDKTIILGDFVWEVESKELKNLDNHAGKEGTLVLTPKQYQLLKCLYDAHPSILKKEEIIGQVWGNTFTSPESLPQLIIRTRQAIGDSTKQILVNEPGIGYSLKFQLPAAKEEKNELVCVAAPVEVTGQKCAFGLWQLVFTLMCLVTAYHAFEVGKSFYYASIFKQVHQTNQYPNILSAKDGKVDVLIGESKCVYEKKKLILRC